MWLYSNTSRALFVPNFMDKFASVFENEYKVCLMQNHLFCGLRTMVVILKVCTAMWLFVPLVDSTRKSNGITDVYGFMHQRNKKS